jgi:hypothetical protein
MLLSIADEYGVEAAQIGTTGGDRVRFGTSVDERVADLKALWERGL